MANYLTAGSVDDTTLTHALLLVTTVEGQDIKSKTAKPYPVPQAKKDPKDKEDREVMLLASDVAKGALQEQVSQQWKSRRTQGGHKAPGRVYSLCAEAAVKDNNVVNEVVCYEKYIHVPYGNDMLIIQGERSGVKNKSRLEVISSIRTQKYINQGCQVFLIQMMRKEETEIPERAAPVACAPYRLAPAVMKELAEQLKELFDK
ncbi:hypothetical protein Tco_0056149, partial [Tanacetum coccineum]